MKKKILFIVIAVTAFIFLFAISASAAALTNYCDVELTLTDGSVVTGYCELKWNELYRDNIYSAPNTASEKINWGDIKIFDMRNTNIVGTQVPASTRGTGCNSQAVNVVEYYFPPQTTKVLNTSFTSGWKSLEKVYIPKSVKTFDHSVFTGSLVKEVIFEEGCVLESIGDSCFHKCTNLSTIVFPENLKSIGYNCFYQSGLSGTIVVPNSVTYLAPGAFLSTKVETLILGDGEMTIGHNFAGDHGSVSNSYLKNVYIGTNVTFVPKDSSQHFYKCKNPVNFYIVGENPEELIATLKAQSMGQYLTFITEDEVTESTGAGYGIIRTGYNRCEVFYGSHSFIDENLPYCSVTCDVCGINYNGNDAIHIYELNEGYSCERYLSHCKVSEICSVCAKEGNVTDVGTIMYWLGYSITEEPIGGVYGISQGFYVNEEAIATYKSVTGIALNYGVVAANGSNVTPISVENGEATVASGAISVSLTGVNCFEIKIGGIKETDFEKAIVFNGYVTEKGQVYYICARSVTSTAVPLSYNQAKSI